MMVSAQCIYRVLSAAGEQAAEIIVKEVICSHLSPLVATGMAAAQSLVHAYCALGGHDVKSTRSVCSTVSSIKSKGSEVLIPPSTHRDS